MAIVSVCVDETVTHMACLEALLVLFDSKDGLMFASRLLLKTPRFER